MIRSTKYLAVMVSFFLSSAVNAQTTQSTQPFGERSKLTFERSKEKLQHYSLEGPLVRDYAAVLKFKIEGWREPVYRHGKISKSSDMVFLTDLNNLVSDGEWYKKLQETSFWTLISENQKKYVKKSIFGGYNNISHTSFEEKNYEVYTVHLFATSENDAKLMANALIEILNRLNKDRLIKTQNEAESYTKLVQAEKDKIAQINDELPKAKAEIEKLQAVFHYMNTESAFVEFVEMDKLVRIIDIDIAGANARMAAIREIEQKDGGKNQPLLDQKRVDLNIELAGLLARKKATEEDRDRAKRYNDLLKCVEADQSALQAETNKLNEHTEKMMILKETLVNPPASLMQPVMPLDNKAVIYQLAR